MDEILRQAAVLAVLGFLWWRHVRRGRARALLAAPNLDGDAQVALHLARHVASSRGQRFGAIHVLYALLQDETLATAIREVGGHPEHIERRVDEVIEAGAEDPISGDDVLAVAAYGRPLSCASLWHALVHRAPSVAVLTQAGDADATAVLFYLAHGTKEPSIVWPFTGPVEIVLVNDDFTTMEVVVELLRDVFGLEEERAMDEMMRVHHAGHATIAELPVEVARPKLERARELARGRGYPLWIRANPI